MRRKEAIVDESISERFRHMIKVAQLTIRSTGTGNLGVRLQKYLHSAKWVPLFRAAQPGLLRSCPP